MPTSPEDTRADLTDVELIDEGPFVATPMEAPPEEPMQRAPVIGTPAAVALALALIVAVFAFISRPGLEEEVANNERAQTTLAPTVTSAPTTSIPGVDAVATTLRAIPTFEGGPPEDLPGVISGFDDRGALLVIDRTQPAPQELLIEMIPAETGEARTLLAIGPRPPTGFEGVLSASANTIELLDGDEAPLSALDLAVLEPDAEGQDLLVIDQRASSRSVDLYRSGEAAPAVSWALARGLAVLGSWGDELLLHRADRVWAMSEDGTERLVAEGRLLGFDGRYLVRLSCPVIDACEVIAGTPDEPEARRVAVPDQFEELPVEDWASSIAVSPDGNQLALSVRDGGLSLPTLLDLETGSLRQLGDGMNHRSPVAWSPDGEWLAYVFTDDVMAWRLDADRSWRITVNRDLRTLAWR